MMTLTRHIIIIAVMQHAAAQRTSPTPPAPLLRFFPRRLLLLLPFLLLRYRHSFLLAQACPRYGMAHPSRRKQRSSLTTGCLPTTLQLPLSIRHVVSSHGFAHSFHFFPKRRSHLLCHVLVDAGAQQRLDRVGCPPIDAVFRTQITIADVSIEIRLSKTHYL